MSLGPSGRVDGIAALLLVVAFVLAGWKVFSRPPAVGYASVPQQLSPDGRFRFGAQFVSAAPGQAVHAASIVELAGGGLRAVRLSGSREGAGDVSIRTAAMDAASLRRGAENTPFDRQQIQRGLWRHVKKPGDPVIARATGGSLCLCFWMVTVSLGGWAGSSITWARSTDAGASWSQPWRLVTSPFLNVSALVKGAPLVYQDGQIGLPVYHEFVSRFAEILRISTQGQVRVGRA
ncbi:MAG: exo-alpha-sialidase [Polaromonas sp.]|uniref:exo-alpha-sialidase n=1 Tax=Polaromonas sp. TaxID=1869339 RepID=UPI0027340762|nr:exo-alpha-sialidase [Polaromonas sp.]MDP3797299.1 exo-alpha-sialidase [Polaromonas sp.]